MYYERNSLTSWKKKQLRLVHVGYLIPNLPLKESSGTI